MTRHLAISKHSAGNLPHTSQWGFSVMELSVVIGVLVIFLGLGTMAFSSFIEQNRGLDAGSQLRSVWKAQKLYLIDRLSDPQHLALPAQVSDLGSYLDLSTLTHPESIQVTTLPPTDRRDNASNGGLIKTTSDPASGDSLYDVGKE